MEEHLATDEEVAGSIPAAGDVFLFVPRGPRVSEWDEQKSFAAGV